MLGFEDYNRPERTVGMLEQAIEWIESGRVPLERVCNINYVDFVADQIRTVQSIYEYFNIEFTDRARRAMEEYTRNSPRSARPSHTFDENLAQAISGERAVFGRYQKYFKVPSEI
jgi:hypothetical protein